MSNLSSCPPGYRDDNVFLYHDFPSCTLSNDANKVLFIIWTVFFAACLLEHTYRIYRFTFVDRNNWQLNNWVLSLSYAFWLGSLLCFCLYFDGREFQISVSDNISDGAVLWTCLAIANAAIIVAFNHALQVFTETASTIITHTSQWHKTAGRFFNVMTVLICISCMVPPFFPQLLSGFVARENSINAFCIIYGVLVMIQIALGIVYVNFTKITALSQLNFHLSLPATDPVVVRNLNELVRRMQLISWVLALDLATPLFYILVGAFIRFQYAIIHVILGFTCPPIVIITLIYLKAPVLAFIWQNRFLAHFVGHASSHASENSSASQYGHKNAPFDDSRGVPGALSHVVSTDSLTIPAA